MATATGRRLKHWGWGYEDQQPPHEQVRGGRARRCASTSASAPAEVERPVPLEGVELPPPRLEPPGLAERDLPPGPLRARRRTRYGKSYRDVVRAFRGRFDHPPDVVAHPRDEDELEARARLVRRRGRGGDPVRRRHERRGRRRAALPDGYAGAVTVDLKALDRVLEVDAVSRAARIQAGATGPGLEDQLREHGLTLRHFPQSFEYSTLGGWIATRAGGHFATLATHIDDLVESVRAITPRGRVGEPPPARAPAPGRARTGC